MTECLFCGRDPYHYVHNGIGQAPVAVICCEIACAIADAKDDSDMIEISVGDLRNLVSKNQRPQSEEALADTEIPTPVSLPDTK